MDRETVEDLMGLFHGPMEVMVNNLWDRTAAILSDKVVPEHQGAYCKDAWFYVYYTGPPTIHKDIYLVRLSR